MKKIAVTGANGFVGRHLVAELLANGYAVLAIGGINLPAGSSQENVKNVSVDLSDERAVANLDLRGTEAIIHLAGLAAVGPSFNDPVRYLSTNPALEANLFQRAVQQDVRPRFLAISSGSLYDPASPLPITEASPVSPSSPYAVSKIAQEQLGHYYSKRGFEVLVARPFNHIGPGQNTGFLAPDMASQIVACERNETDVVTVGNLDAKRDYTDVRDIARAYRLLIEKGQNGETYNICSGKSISGHELLEQLLSNSTAKPRIETDPNRMRPADMPDIYGDCDKLSFATGWSPHFDLASTTQDILNDWRER